MLWKKWPAISLMQKHKVEPWKTSYRFSRLLHLLRRETKEIWHPNKHIKIVHYIRLCTGDATRSISLPGWSSQTIGLCQNKRARLYHESHPACFSRYEVRYYSGIVVAIFVRLTMRGSVMSSSGTRYAIHQHISALDNVSLFGDPPYLHR